MFQDCTSFSRTSAYLIAASQGKVSHQLSLKIDELFEFGILLDGAVIDAVDMPPDHKLEGGFMPYKVQRGSTEFAALLGERQG